MIILFITLPIVWCISLYYGTAAILSATLQPSGSHLINNGAKPQIPEGSRKTCAESSKPPTTSFSNNPSSPEIHESPGNPARIRSQVQARSFASHTGSQDDSNDSRSPRGVLMFRGNAGRTFYGEGPLPDKPVIRWKANLGSLNGWSGTGWTGQAAVVEWPPETARLMFPRGNCPEVEVIVGGLDGRVHFFDGHTGHISRKPFAPPRRDNIKGSVVVDPDGYPIIYFGNRGGAYWIVSLIDYRVLGSVPGKLDPRNQVDVGYWPDFDSSGIICDGDLLEGGENGWFYRIPLKRHLVYNEPQKVVPPMKEWKTIYTPEATRLSRESTSSSGGYVSIESSPCMAGDHIFLGTGSGMVLGLDRRSLKPEFQFYAGDDIDASIVADEEGYLYAACESDYNPRNETVLWKLDPTVPKDKWKQAAMWKITFPARPSKGNSGYEDNIDAGIIGTPALGPSPEGAQDARLYVPVATRPFQEGLLVCVDTGTGKILWKKKLLSHIWSSPAVIEDRVIAADVAGVLHCHRTGDGKELWEKAVGGVIESTPVVWKGWIYVGSKDGYFYALSAPEKPSVQAKEKRVKNI